MSDTQLVKEVGKRLPSAAHLGHGGLKKPQMVEVLFQSILEVLTSKKHGPKKSEARAKARDLANTWLTKHCAQSNGHYFWKSAATKE
jgi:hypothetical protein